MQTIDEASLAALAAGCAVFGAGGGGDPMIGHLMSRQAVADCGPVELVDLEDLPEDGLVLPSAMVGAPTVMGEKIANGEEGKRIQDMYERFLGRPVVALMSAELGGINGVLPISWAARSGLPFVDADLMGRAFPELQMCSTHLKGVPISPVVVTDERANNIIFETMDDVWAERLVRTASITLGGAASLVIYPMTVAQAREATIQGSISRAIEVGRLLTEAEEGPIQSLLAEVNGYKLIEGKIVDVERRTTEGFARGRAAVEGTGDFSGDLLRIEFQNENLAALSDGDVLASVPDIVSVLDTATGHPVVTEQLRYGQRVTVMAFPCDPIWRSPEALEVVGPTAFGYDFPYDPVENRHG